jgi:hypothetical protein
MGLQAAGGSLHEWLLLSLLFLLEKYQVLLLGKEQGTRLIKAHVNLSTGASEEVDLRSMKKESLCGERF